MPYRAAKYSQCGQARHTHFTEPENTVFMHPSQGRPGLRYATANNGDGTHLDVYTSGFWGGKQTSEGIL